MDGDDEVAKQYRERAQQLVALAEETSNQKSKDFLLQVAMDYLQQAITRERSAREQGERNSK